MASMHVKKGDRVVVLAGKDKGKEGTVTRVLHESDKVIVDGVNLGAQTSYTFSNVSANHTVSVVFVVETYTITASANVATHAAWSARCTPNPTPIGSRVGLPISTIS